jgi:NhaP-type Na+/H+ or K+/H+ antiporter
MFDQPTIQFALIAVLGLFCQWTAWRLKLPAILFLLLTGILFGPYLDIIQPDLLLGDLLFPIISVSVALILFEGSLTLNYQEIKGQSRVVQRLTTVGMIISWLLIACATKYWMQTDWQFALLFGAITVVSGPTVVMPILKTVRPTKNIANILRWEGILIDPIGALMAVLTYEFILTVSTQEALNNTIIVFFRIVLFAGLLGFFAAYLLGNIIRNQLLPDYLYNLATISLVAGVFAGANAIEHESGLYAVTIMGVTLANMKRVAIEEIISFKEHLSILLISSVFILLAARLSPWHVYALGIPAIGLFLTLQLVVRPLMVFLVTADADLNWREKILISWIYPRGIVAAAVAALFSLHVGEELIQGAEMLVPLTFAMIIGTVVLQSLTAKPLANLLGVAQKKATGVLFVGSNRVSREIAKAVQEQGYDVILADSNWEYIKNARMENLPTFYGNPVSEYAEKHLDISSIGKLVATSPLKDLNALACSKYRSDFGSQNLFYLNSSSEANISSKHQVAETHRGLILLNEAYTYTKLNNEFKKGAKLKTTNISEEFTFHDLMSQQKNQVPIFAIDKKHNLVFFTQKDLIQPKAGWKVTSIVLSKQDDE